MNGKGRAEMPFGVQKRQRSFLTGEIIRGGDDVCVLPCGSIDITQSEIQERTVKEGKQNKGVKAGMGGTCLGKGMYPIQLALHGQGEQ